MECTGRDKKRGKFCASGSENICGLMIQIESKPCRACQRYFKLFESIGAEQVCSVILDRMNSSIS